MTEIENRLGSLELRGVSDMHDGSIDHLFQIGALIAAAQGIKNDGYRWDMWEVNEAELKLIRHVRVWRQEMFDPRHKLANKAPVPIVGQWSRLTGERVTYKQYKDGSTVTIRDEDFMAMKNTRSKDPKEWRGRVEFKLKHKPQLRHKSKTAPRPHDPMIGREKSSVVNDEVMEFRQSDVVKNVESEVLDRRMRVSRNVEEHELEKTLRSLPQHDSKMKELLLQLFNLDDPETGAPRTTDRWIMLPRYWIRMHHEWRDCYFDPDDAPSPVDGKLSDHLYGDRYTMFFDSSDPSMIDTGHQNDWSDIEMPDGTVRRCDDPSAKTGHKWVGYTLFVPLDRPTAGENAEQQTDDKSAIKPKMLKTPGEPSESERRLHELTHLPYRDWCEHCVKAKGRQSHSVKKNDRQPVIQIDFSFLATENDLPKRTILNATDVQTGYAMAVVLPAKGSVEKYAVAELRRFVFEIGRTFGIIQYDKENALKVIAKDLCKTIGGLSMRAAPTGHSQSQGSVGNVQRTLYGQLRALMSQVQESTGLKLTSESPMFVWCVKHAQWLINRYLIGSDGKTAYNRRWSRDYGGSLCMFGEWIDAKMPHSNKLKIPKGGQQWFSGVYLGKDTEADEVIVGNADGVFKVRTVKRRPPSQQWNAVGVTKMLSVPWQPKGDGVDSNAFVMPPDLGVQGRVKPPPGLSRVDEEEENEQLEDLPPGQTESLTVQELLENDGSDRLPSENVHDPPESSETVSKKARIDPDTPATEPVNKQMRISAVHHLIAGVIPACQWVASIVGVGEVVGKDGTKVEVEVNAEEGELEQELRLAEPLLWESEFPPEAEKKGMMKEMQSMKDFDVYDEVPVKDCTDEQINEALDCRWVKVWKNETDLRCRVVVRGCFQNVEKNEEDNLFASTPSLVTMRLLLCMALARNWGITLGDVSTAFLHAAMLAEVFVWPPKEFYPNGDCLWKLKKAMYGLRQAPKLWQEHFAEVMTAKLGFRRCKSDPNLYCHESGGLYVLAYVDDLLVVGTEQMRKEFMSKLSEEVLLKETGKLVPGTEHTFLGRRLRHNGDSIDVCMSQTYVDTILDLYGMKNAKPVATTGSVTIAKTVADTPLSPEEHSVYRTAVGKLLWLALIRGDIAYATKELSRDVTAPTMQSVAKLKHLLRYLNGTKMCVLRLRPSYQLSDGNCSLDVNVYVDSDWAGCSKTRKSTSGSTVNVLGCNMISTARTQGTLALSSGEAELYAIGQGVSEALFVRSMLLESKLAKKISVTAHTDSTAGKSMATRFGTGKKTKHVELRFLYMQNLVQMGLLKMAKIHGQQNPADLMTKYVATDVLSRLLTHLGVVSNWFKGDAETDAHDTDDHVAALNAHMRPPTLPRARFLPHCACVYSAHNAHNAHQCTSWRRWTEVHAEGLSA